jgi:hypothetical protein
MKTMGDRSFHMVDADTPRPRRSFALAAVASVGVVTTVLAASIVVLVITDPVGTATAVDAHDARVMASAIASLIWRGVVALLTYL